MIEKLTVQQEQKMEEYVNKYENLFLGGDDSYNEKSIKEGIDFVYSMINLSPPKIVICNSPLELKTKAGLKKGESFDSFGGGYDVGWTSFYDYIQEVLGIKYDKSFHFDKWKSFIVDTGIFATVLYDQVAFVCIRPCFVSRDNNDELHCENDMAIKWKDGYGEYFLHGVSVPKEIVLTPAEQLDPELALKETNADVQREIIRKIGAERLLVRTNAEELDSFVDPNTNYIYKLYLMKINDIRRKYLYFEHASLKGVFYAKPVPIETKKALHGRAWILSMVERKELQNIDDSKEAEIIANLPNVVS